MQKTLGPDADKYPLKPDNPTQLGGARERGRGKDERKG